MEQVPLSSFKLRQRPEEWRACLEEGKPLRWLQHRALEREKRDGAGNEGQT